MAQHLSTNKKVELIIKNNLQPENNKPKIFILQKINFSHFKLRKRYPRAENKQLNHFKNHLYGIWYASIPKKYSENVQNTRQTGCKLHNRQLSGNVYTSRNSRYC